MRFFLEHDGSEISRKIMDEFGSLPERRPDWQSPGIHALAHISGTFRKESGNSFSMETDSPLESIAIQLQSLCRHNDTDTKIRIRNGFDILVINRWGMLRETRETSLEALVRFLNAGIALCPPQERWSSFRKVFGEASDFARRVLNGHSHRSMGLVRFEEGWRLVLNDGIKKVFGPLKRKMTLLPSSSLSESREILAGIYDTEKDFDGRKFSVSREFSRMYPQKGRELLRLALA